jgi:hypothetical protein
VGGCEIYCSSHFCLLRKVSIKNGGELKEEVLEFVERKESVKWERGRVQGLYRADGLC